MAKDLLIDRLQQVDPVNPNLFRVFNEITDSPKTIIGIQKLAQMVEKLLLTTPGTDLFNPLSGGGFLSLLGTNVDSGALQDIFSRVQQSIGFVSQEILSGQEGTDIPLDEQLDALELINVDFENNDTLTIKILIRSKSGQRIITNLP
jgi:phage baseplate assembly protein W